VSGRASGRGLDSGAALGGSIINGSHFTSASVKPLAWAAS